jgi:hypothetical protein
MTAGRLLSESRQMEQASPVFIVGEARSGTSILYRTLQKHSSFSPREINLVETEIFAQLRRTFMFRLRYPETLRRYMLGDEEEWRGFLSSIRIPRMLSALLIPANFVVKDRSDRLWKLNLSHLTVRSYFFHARLARGCRRLVEKTPTNTVNLKKLTLAFPRAQLLYIHRHPIDVFSSYRRRGRDDPNAAWARALAPSEFCARFEASARRALDWNAAGRRNLLLVSYERFTSDPESSFREMCDWLDEPFEPSALKEDAPQPGRWRGDPQLWAEIVPTTKAWKEFVTPDEADEIQQRLRLIMTAFGYRPKAYQ